MSVPRGNVCPHAVSVLGGNVCPHVVSACGGNVCMRTYCLPTLSHERSCLHPALATAEQLTAWVPPPPPPPPPPPHRWEAPFFKNHFFSPPFPQNVRPFPPPFSGSKNYSPGFPPPPSFHSKTYGWEADIYTIQLLLARWRCECCCCESECALGSGQSGVCSRWCVLRVVLCDRLVLTLKWAEEGDLILSHQQNVGTFLCSTFFESLSCHHWCIRKLTRSLKTFVGKFHAFNTPRELGTVNIIITVCCRTQSLATFSHSSSLRPF